MCSILSSRSITSMEGSTHTSDMDVSKITSTLDQAASVHFTRFVSLLYLIETL